MWQCFNLSWKFEEADRGVVAHTKDWDDLGHPFDKLLLTVTIEYDTTAGGPITLQMDTMTGIGGVTINPNVTQFTLGSGRGKTTFPIPADTVAKMIRIYPTATLNAGYKQWAYVFDKIPYPADTVRVTGWKDAASPVDKEPSWLWIDADTAGVAASVQLQNEIGTVMTISHTGTSSNRKKNYAIPADTRAKMWRLVAAEGTSGKFQLFGWGFERWQPFPLEGPVDPPEVIACTPWRDFGYPYEKLARNLSLTINTNGYTGGFNLQTTELGTVFSANMTTTFGWRKPATYALPANLVGKMWRLTFNAPTGGGLVQLWDWDLDCVQEPASVTYWDSYEQTLGAKFYKFIMQGWWMYICASVVTLTVTSDTGVFTKVLPVHMTRAEERFYLPSVWGTGLNKSKVYRVTLSAATPLKFYPAGSGFEYMVIGGDRHAGLLQSTFQEMMAVAG
jgi:hypothetical protein